MLGPSEEVTCTSFLLNQVTAELCTCYNHCGTLLSDLQTAITVVLRVAASRWDILIVLTVSQNHIAAFATDASVSL